VCKISSEFLLVDIALLAFLLVTLSSTLSPYQRRRQFDFIPKLLVLVLVLVHIFYSLLICLLISSHCM
jgi:hypothetical protein